MLKSLSLVLLIAAAGCKSDAPATSKPSTASEGTAGETPSSGGAKPRSGKVDLGPRKPSLPGDQATPDEPKAGDKVDDSRKTRGDRRRDRMAIVDSDGDGVISDEEREAARKQRAADMLARLDKDGDGKISDAERADSQRHRAEETRTRLDKDGDGKVSAEELGGGGRRLRGLSMETADKNKDGDVSVDELEAAMKERRASFRGRRGRGAGSAGSAAPDDDAAE